MKFRYLLVFFLLILGCENSKIIIEDKKCFSPEDINENDKERINVCFPFSNEGGSILKLHACDAVKDGFRLWHDCAVKLVNLNTTEVILSWPLDVNNRIKQGFVKDELRIRRNRYGAEYSELLSDCVKDKCCLDEERSKYGRRRQFYVNEIGECRPYVFLEDLPGLVGHPSPMPLPSFLVK